MRWREVDFDSQLWTIPAARAKNAKAHDVHLASRALDILASLPRLTTPEGGPSELVFTTTGHTGFNGFSKAKAMLDERSGVRDLPTHTSKKRAQWASGGSRDKYR